MAAGLTALGFEYGEPRGGFFFWADSSTTGISALELCYLILKEAKVLIFPGTAFGEAWVDYLRITTLQPVELLTEAISRITPIIQNLSTSVTRPMRPRADRT